jgi:UPF0755 protein
LKKFLIFLLILILLIGGAALYGWNYYNDIGQRPLTTNEDLIEIVVEPNDNFSRLLTRLDDEGLVRNLLLTRIYFRNNPIETALKPGTFEVHGKGTLHEIITELNEGEDIYEITVTIPEGMTIERMGEVMEEKELFSKDAFIEAARNYIVPSWLENIDQRRYVLEGFLAPATYKFKKGQTPSYVVDTMYKAFVSRMFGIIEELDETLPTSEWNEIITIASMIEREAANIEEMPRISSVIYNRLAIRQKLQIDATVVYALGLNSKDTVTLDDLKVDSPFNTYVVGALPVGPISNPGAAAIKAALRPEVTEYTYYVLDPAAGQHFFTSDYNEFLRKKGEFANQ